MKHLTIDCLMHSTNIYSIERRQARLTLAEVTGVERHEPNGRTSNDARVAQLYYEDRLKQAEISERLHVSQATVSRLLKRAEEEGVVRVTIVAPRGTYPAIRDGPPSAVSPQRGDRR